MLNFQNYLVEVFGSNFDYKVPADKEKQLYDFFMLSFIFNSTQKKVPKNPNEEDKVKYAVAEVRDKLLPVLQKEMLSAVFFSICAEFRYVLDYNDVNTCIKIIEEDLGTKYSAVLKKYFKDYGLRTNSKMQSLARRPDTSMFVEKGKKPDYKKSFQSAVKASPILSDIVEVAEVLFLKAKWANAYGGKAWAGIAKGWLQLNRAKNANDQMVWIDHVYDLQHNTGSVFTKVDSYAKSGGYHWLKDALDFKRDIKTPHALLDKVSFPLRTLALRAIRKQFGGAEKYINPKPEDIQFASDGGSLYKDDDFESPYEKEYKDKFKYSDYEKDKDAFSTVKSFDDSSPDVDFDIKNLFHKIPDIPFVMAWIKRKLPNVSIDKVYKIGKQLGYADYSSNSLTNAVDHMQKYLKAFADVVHFVGSFPHLIVNVPINIEQIKILYKTFEDYAALSPVPFKNTSTWTLLTNSNHKIQGLDSEDTTLLEKYKWLLQHYLVIENIAENGFKTKYRFWDAIQKVASAFPINIKEAVELLKKIFPNYANEFDSVDGETFKKSINFIKKTLSEFDINGSDVYQLPLSKCHEFSKVIKVALGHSELLDDILSVIDMKSAGILDQVKKIKTATGLSLMDAKYVSTAGIAIYRSFHNLNSDNTQSSDQPTIQDDENQISLIQKKIKDFNITTSEQFAHLAVGLNQTHNINPEVVAKVSNNNTSPFLIYCHTLQNEYKRAAEISKIDEKEIKLLIVHMMTYGIPFASNRNLFNALLTNKPLTRFIFGPYQSQIFTAYTPRLQKCFYETTNFIESRKKTLENNDGFTYALLKLNSLTQMSLEACYKFATTMTQFTPEIAKRFNLKSAEWLYNTFDNRPGEPMALANNMAQLTTINNVAQAELPVIEKYLNFLYSHNVKLYDLMLVKYVDQNTLKAPLELVKKIKIRTGLPVLSAKNLAMLVLAYYRVRNKI